MANPYRDKRGRFASARGAAMQVAGVTGMALTPVVAASGAVGTAAALATGMYGTAALGAAGTALTPRTYRKSKNLYKRGKALRKSGMSNK